MLALGLDLGTTSISAAAVAADARIVARVTRPHRADLETGLAGRAEQSPAVLLEMALDVLAELAGQLNGRPACLGLTGQMHSLLLADNQLNPLGNVITWQDKRSLESAGADGSWLERFRTRCDAAAVLRTGCTPSPGYLAVTLFTLQGQGLLPDVARHASILADWLAATLTASKPVTDRTNAASTGVFDLEQDGWSHLIEATGLPRELFPDVVDSGKIVGGLTARFADRTGLPVGLPVAAAVGDHQAAVLGSLPAGEKALHVNIGTGGQVSLPISRFVQTQKSDTRYLPEGRYLLVGAGLAGGDAYAWVRRTCERWLDALPDASIGRSANRDEGQVMDAINRLAAAVLPGCDGLRCEPFFRGTRREPDRRGLFSGITIDNFTPGHVARAVLEGIAEALAGFACDHAALPDISGPFTRVVATGNAVKRNQVLAECIARAFGRPVFVPEHEEEAAFGAAVLAGVQTGLWQSLNQAGAEYRLRLVASPDANG